MVQPCVSLVGRNQPVAHEVKAELTEGVGVVGAPADRRQNNSQPQAQEDGREEQAAKNR